MKVSVVGAGAMGGLFGTLLAEAGHEVWLLDIWTEHVERINRHGLLVEVEGQTRQVRHQAVVQPHQIGPSDLVIIFVKAPQTGPAAASAAKLIKPEGLVLTLQNGLGNAETISKYIDPARILAGATAHGATLLGPGSIRHAGRGQTVIGFWSGGPLEKAEEVAAMFTAAGIETEAAAEIKPIVWEKLLVNVGINAITALTGIKNGQLLDMEITKELVRGAVREALGVAEALDVKIRPDVIEHVYSVARMTAPNRSSMGQDVDNRRQTEIMAINGAIVAEARRLGLAAPINMTLTALVQTIEGHYL